MKTSEWFEAIAGVAVAALIITMMFRDQFRKRRIVASLAARAQHNGVEFGRGFFSHPKRADIATRAREVLSKNLKMPLEGLTPSDRLNEDLNAELAANPHLFWELEAEFGIKTDVEDLDSHEKTLERLVTFQDLVEYIELKISTPQSQTPDENANEEPSRVYDVAIRSIPILCVGGFLIAVLSILFQKQMLLKV